MVICQVVNNSAPHYYLGLRYRKTFPSVTHNARVFLFGVLQGLPRSPQSSVLSMPTATPHAVLVRSGSTRLATWVRLPSLLKRTRECGDLMRLVAVRISWAVGSSALPSDTYIIPRNTPKVNTQIIVYPTIIYLAAASAFTHTCTHKVVNEGAVARYSHLFEVCQPVFLSLTYIL